jgi:hypothetical protein
MEEEYVKTTKSFAVVLAATQREGKTEREDWEEAILTLLSLILHGQRIRIWFRKKQFTC